MDMKRGKTKNIITLCVKMYNYYFQNKKFKNHF